MKKSLISGVLLVLILAAGAQLTWHKDLPPARGIHLAKALPMNLPGWMGQDVPLGANETVQGAVENTLQFDDVYFREFKSPRGMISLYVAYWGPGKMPTQLVASHTPDRCWVENGWRCDEVRHSVRLTDGSNFLRAGEWRIFAAPNQQRLNVQFWHLVGGETYDYGDRLNRMPSVWRWWRDVAKQVFKVPAEQYFIRLTSDRPFDELNGDPGWAELVSALAKLGLEEPLHPSTQR